MSPPSFLDSDHNGQFFSFKSISGSSPPNNPSNYHQSSNINMNSSSSSNNNNSNYGTTPFGGPSINNSFGFNSPAPPHLGGGGGSRKPAAGPTSRPRLVKVRKQSSLQHPRSSASTPDLGFNPFRTLPHSDSSTSIFSNLNSVGGNVNTPAAKGTFLFGASGSANSSMSSEMGNSSGILDGVKQLNLGSGSVNDLLVFRGGRGSQESVVMDQLHKEIRKLNIFDSRGNVQSFGNSRGADDPTSSMSEAIDRFSSVFGSGTGVPSELPKEMTKMKNKDERGADRGSGIHSADNTKCFVFGSSEAALPKKMINLNIKDSLNTSENSSISGNSRSTIANTDRDRKAENLISDEMQKLKVGSGAGDPSGQVPLSQASIAIPNELHLPNFSNRKSGDPLHSGTDDKNSSGIHLSQDHGNNETKLHDTTACSTSPSFSSSYFQPVQNAFDAATMNKPVKKVEFTFTSRLDSMETPHVKFKTASMKSNIFSSASSKLEAKESVKDARSKKKKGKLRKPTKDPLKIGLDFGLTVGSSQQNSESFEAYSPMDCSPYRETLAENTYSRETSVASDDTSHFGDNYASNESRAAAVNDATDEDLVSAIHRLDISECHAEFSGLRDEVSESNFNKGNGAEGPSEESVSGAETESFLSATEHFDYCSDTFVTAVYADLSSTATTGRHDSDDMTQFTFASNAEDIGRSNFMFAASSSTQGQSSTETRHHKKKHRLKMGHDSYSSIPKYASSSVEFFPVPGSSTLLSPGQGKKSDASTFSSRSRDKSEPVKEQEKEKSFPTSAASTAAQEACEKWRLRGNQAYANGDLSKAEDYYTQGVNSISQSETSKSFLRALMLCYSNRAATRMSLGRMREALKDCLMASGLDPNFLKVQVRAANCYLAVGEVENALLHFMRCLQSGADVCVDRKLLVEASEGLEKTQKVSECIHQSTELLQKKTSEDVECALKLIDEALQISSCSDKLLEMKADALFMLRKYERVIQLCEHTLNSAEMNSPNSSGDGSDVPRSSSTRLWRFNLIVRSYFYLGRLEEALDFVKKQEDSEPLMGSRGSTRQESAIPLADVVRELLSRKAAGNEAFQSGRHAVAVEHYTAAISCNVESRPFAAICFCNRAAAYRSMGQITDAIADCSLAIALDGTYLKALSRRASLFEMIRDYGQAAVDYQRLITLLTKRVEEKGNPSFSSDKLSYVNELRQNQRRLSLVEEEDRKEIPLNMYLILGIEPSAAASDIKKAYRKAALKHHPDKAGQTLVRSENGDDGLWREIAEEVHKDTDRLFKMIGEAYAVLSNPTKRSRYDLEEDMRNEPSRFTTSSTSRMYADDQNFPFERSASRRQWQEFARQYGGYPSKASDRTRTSRYP